MKKIMIAVFACLLLTLTAVAAGNKSTTYQGWVTDEKCTAGVLQKGAGNPVCAKKCIEDGAKAVFVNESDRSIWPIENPESIQGHEGHHVEVTGSTANKVIHIDSVKMLAEKTKKDGDSSK